MKKNWDARSWIGETSEARQGQYMIRLLDKKQVLLTQQCLMLSGKY